MRYRIADLEVKMESFGRTLQQAEADRVNAEGPADITIDCDADPILALNPNLPDAETAMYMGSGAIFPDTCWVLTAHTSTHRR